MSVEFAYFKSVKARSVAIMGGNNKHIFYIDKPTKVTDPGDIYIFRKKAEKVIETDQYGQPLDPNANDYVQTEQGVVRRRSAPPRSHITYGGLDSAKRKQLESEQRMKAKEAEESSDENDNPEKQSIDDELSAEDDLNVDDGDFDFEKGDGRKNPKQSKKLKRKEGMKPKPKKTKTKSKSKLKSSSEKEEVKKKKTTSSTKKKKSEKKKDIKSRLNKLRGFKT